MNSDSYAHASRVSILGLGYVGSTVAGCLAQTDRRILGFDPAVPNADALLNSRAVRVEHGLRERIEQGLTSGAIELVPQAHDAIQRSDVTLLCVGTPLRGDGTLTLDYLSNAVAQVGDALKTKRGYHLVVVRSTVPPGTTRPLVADTLKRASGRRISQSDLGLVFQPEFLREGTAVADFFSPPMTVFGALNWDRKPLDILRELYRAVNAPLYQMSPEGAEMVKLVSNAFHALKVVFANEVGVICREHGVDSADLMDVFARDSKLNLSPQYLQPGFAFGGPCLPKDLSALVALSKALDTPVLKSIAASNDAQIERAIGAIERTACKRIGIVGISHKEHTGDLRGSPAMMLIERLVERGYYVAAFDKAIRSADYARCVDSLDDLSAQSDMFVIVEGHTDEIAHVVGERPVVELSPFDGSSDAIRIV